MSERDKEIRTKSIKKTKRHKKELLLFCVVFVAFFLVVVFVDVVALFETR